MSNLSITFEISRPMSTHYVHIKDNAKYRNWSRLKHLGVNQDKWKQHYSIERVRVPKTSY